MSKPKGFDIDIGRTEDTNDFCILIRDGKTPATPAVIIEALKECIEYLEKVKDCKGTC